MNHQPSLYMQAFHTIRNWAVSNRVEIRFHDPRKTVIITKEGAIRFYYGKRDELVLPKNIFEAQSPDEIALTFAVAQNFRVDPGNGESEVLLVSRDELLAHIRQTHKLARIPAPKRP